MDLGEVVRLADADDVAQTAATDAVERLRTGIEARGRAVWVLAGGSSPMAAYRVLAATNAETLDWSRVCVIIGDERMVPRTDPDSNLSAIVEVLLGTPQTATMTVVWPNVDATPEIAAKEYAQELLILSDDAGAPVIDLVWLGVGEDGHTLSLFPGRDDVGSSEDLVVAVRDSPKPPPARITLTSAALARARRVVIFATGAAKRAALAEVFRDGTLPVARVAQHARRSGADVTWFFDAAAS